MGQCAKTTGPGRPGQLAVHVQYTGLTAAGRTCCWLGGASTDRLLLLPPLLLLLLPPPLLQLSGLAPPQLTSGLLLLLSGCTSCPCRVSTLVGDCCGRRRGR